MAYLLCGEEPFVALLCEFPFGCLLLFGEHDKVTENDGDVKMAVDVATF